MTNRIHFAPLMAKEFRIWHNSNFGEAAFYAPVPDVETAKKQLTLLANYDLYQGDRVVANAQGLEVREGQGEWEEWENEEGDDISAVMSAEQEGAPVKN